MPFYLRKAYKKGPVRLNLSKSGLGLSLGITGARLGVNSRGTYVHGGRHGLYYRKNLPKNANANQRQTNDTQTVELFSDTGVTYHQKNSAKCKPYEIEYPPSTSALANITLIFGGIALIVSLFLSIEIVFLALLLIAASAIIRASKKNRLRKAIAKILEVTTNIEKGEELPDNHHPEIQKILTSEFKEYFCESLHAQVSEIAFSNESIETSHTLKMLEKSYPIDKSKQIHIRRSILGNILDELIDDGMLTHEEENAFFEAVSICGLQKEDIPDELKKLEQFKQLRILLESPLSEIKVNFPLLRGEKAYAVFNIIRILNERVKRRFQQDKVQYKETGYEIDMEGIGYLTDRRLLILEKGSREIRLNTILDTIVDAEGGIIELVVSNRKNPLILTCENVLELSVMIEKVRASQLEEK